MRSKSKPTPKITTTTHFPQLCQHKENDLTYFKEECERVLLFYLLVAITLLCYDGGGSIMKTSKYSFHSQSKLVTEIKKHKYFT